MSSSREEIELVEKIQQFYTFVSTRSFIQSASVAKVVEACRKSYLKYIKSVLDLSTPKDERWQVFKKNLLIQLSELTDLFDHYKLDVTTIINDIKSDKSQLLRSLELEEEEPSEFLERLNRIHDDNISIAAAYKRNLPETDKIKSAYNRSKSDDDSVIRYLLNVQSKQNFNEEYAVNADAALLVFKESSSSQVSHFLSSEKNFLVLLALLKKNNLLTNKNFHALSSIKYYARYLGEALHADTKLTQERFENLVNYAPTQQQIQILKSFLEESGNWINAYTKLSPAIKIIFLQRATTEECWAFLASLDKLYLINNAGINDADFNDFIATLKSINNLYHNNLCKYSIHNSSHFLIVPMLRHTTKEPVYHRMEGLQIVISEIVNEFIAKYRHESSSQTLEQQIKSYLAIEEKLSEEAIFSAREAWAHDETIGLLPDEITLPLPFYAFFKNRSIRDFLSLHPESGFAKTMRQLTEDEIGRQFINGLLGSLILAGSIPENKIDVHRNFFEKNIHLIGHLYTMIKFFEINNNLNETTFDYCLRNLNSLEEHIYQCTLNDVVTQAPNLHPVSGQALQQYGLYAESKTSLSSAIINKPVDEKRYVMLAKLLANEHKIERKHSKPLFTEDMFHSEYVQFKREKLKNLLDAIIQGDPDTVQKISENYPILLFEKLDKEVITTSSGQKSASKTPYQLALAEEDMEIAALLRTQLLNLVGEQAADAQFNKQFPEGWKEAEKQEWHHIFIHLEKLAQTIKDANQPDDIISSGSPNYTLTVNEGSEVAKALSQFRLLLDAMLNKIVTTGRHFNPKLLQRAFRIYSDQYRDYFGATSSDPIAMLFWQQVIGYIERLLPANYAQAACDGFDITAQKFKNNSPQSRSFEFDVCYWGPKGWPLVQFYPLNLSRLGFDFALYGGKGLALGQIERVGAPSGIGWPALHSWEFFEDYINQKQQIYKVNLKPNLR